jgi:hypothetical protein
MLFLIQVVEVLKYLKLLDVTIPNSYKIPYSDTDLVIFVTSRPVTTGVLAW